MALREIGDALLTREETARALGVAPLTLSRWVSRRRIGAYRVARRLVFGREHIRAFLSRNEIPPREN